MRVVVEIFWLPQELSDQKHFSCHKGLTTKRFLVATTTKFDHHPDNIE